MIKILRRIKNRGGEGGRKGQNKGLQSRKSYEIVVSNKESKRCQYFHHPLMNTYILYLANAIFVLSRIYFPDEIPTNVLQTLAYLCVCTNNVDFIKVIFIQTFGQYVVI